VAANQQVWLGGSRNGRLLPIHTIFYLIYLDRLFLTGYDWYMDIRVIQEKITLGNYRFSDHAIKRMIERNIERTEVEEAIHGGTIIEEYPDDKYSPSCLIYGQTLVKRDLHIQASLPPKVVIVTIYEPDPSEWVEYRVRR